jgi:hypothetical protein
MNDSDDLDDAPFVHRRTDAATAPPVQTTGVSSPFSGLGRLTPPVTVNSETMPAMSRLVKTLEACGPLTAKQVAEAMNMKPGTAAALMSDAQSRGLAVKHEKVGKGYTYRLADGVKSEGVDVIAPTSGFKGWLAKQASKEAEQEAAKASPPRASGRRPSSQRGLVVGVFNTGEVHVTLGQQSLTLGRDDALELAGYLHNALKGG